MERLTEARVSEYVPTIYSTPCTMEYALNGRLKKGDIFAERDSVIIVVYNVSREVLVFVKQFRPALYVHDVPACDKAKEIDVEKYPACSAVTVELCAGLVDKKLPVERIAQEEVLEECGYKVSLSDLTLVCVFPNGGETSGARQTMFYCEVTDEMKVSEGGGVDDEIIEVMEMRPDEVLEYVSKEDVRSPVNVLFGIYWFLENKCKARF